MANKKRRSSKKSVDNGSGPKKAREESPVREYSLECRKPAHTMEDLVGLDDIKATLRKIVIMPFLLTQTKKAETKKYGVKAPKGVLLKGAPGTGKTVLAEAIVNELNRHLKTKVKLFTETGQCLTKWVGETEANLRSLFEKAKKSGPSVIFFDEIDGIARQRDCGVNASTSALTTLLEEMNQVERGQVLVIAATNFSDLVDAALLREGRFDLKLSIPIPDADSRREIFTHYLAKKKYKIEKQALDRLVNETASWTGSAIESFVDNVQLEMLDRLFPNMSLLTAPNNIAEKKMADNRLITLNHLLPILMKWKKLKETSN